MRRSLVFLAPLALALAACASGESGAAPAGGGLAFGPAGAPAKVDSTVGRAAVPAPAQGGQTVTGQSSLNTQNTQNGVPIPQAFDPERNLILTAQISMRASDPWTISDKAQSIAIGLGGDVMGLSQSGTGDQRNAVLTLRVPSDRFNEALRQLRALGADVVSSTVNGQDVTDQFVDLKARLAATQLEEQRYLALLARADKIDDILKIDQSLANVRTRVEQLQGAINSISTRTKFSTITLSVATVPPVTKPVEPLSTTAWDPGKTIDRALAALAALARVGVDIAIWTLFLGWIPLLAVAVVALVNRGRTAPKTA